MKYEIMAKRPQTVSDAMRLAKLEEEKSAAIRKNTKGSLTKALVPHTPLGGSNHQRTAAVASGLQ